MASQLGQVVLSSSPRGLASGLIVQIGTDRRTAAIRKSERNANRPSRSGEYSIQISGVLTNCSVALQVTNMRSILEP